MVVEFWVVVLLFLVRSQVGLGSLRDQKVFEQAEPFD